MAPASQTAILTSLRLSFFELFRTFDGVQKRKIYTAMTSNKVVGPNKAKQCGIFMNKGIPTIPLFEKKICPKMLILTFEPLFFSYKTIFLSKFLH